MGGFELLDRTALQGLYVDRWVANASQHWWADSVRRWDGEKVS
jgi:hypothetical protein